MSRQRKVTSEIAAKTLTGAVVPMAAGGLEGAERTHRATASWTPRMGTPDSIINPAKPMADARARDTALNDAYVANGVNVRKDSIVGAEYRLSADPSWLAIPGADEVWAEEFQNVVEGRFRLAMESDLHWIDASGINTFTSLVRMAVGTFILAGETFSTAEWMREARRPFQTAIQMVSPDRVCNPNNGPDTRTMRRGIERDARNRPLRYHIRMAHPHESYDGMNWQWKAVPARMKAPWNRVQVIHLYDQAQPDQSRGFAEMLAGLKETKMGRQFRDIVLQNAIVQATYAAAIESEIPQEAMLAMMGASSSGDGAYNEAIATYLSGLTDFLGGTNNIRLDGVMIPHLYPGTKLNVKPVGNPGGVGSDFEASLLRYTAASLGVSYEELSRDYTKLNYSGGKLAIASIEKGTNVKKRTVADAFANHVYALWLEEEINAGNVPLPRGATSATFYEPLMREAFTRCRWIGAGRGQIDEMKETQAGIMRVNAGFSTHEIELARLGLDWREVFAQRAREQKKAAELGLTFALDATRPGQGSSQETMQGNGDGADAEATSDQGNN